MIETLLAQERYGRRYVIVKSPEALQLFRERMAEFDKMVGELKTLPGRDEIPIADIAKLHDEYSVLFSEGFKHLMEPDTPEGKEFEEMTRQKQEEMLTLIGEMSAKARGDQNEKMLSISDRGTKAYWITALLCILGVSLGVCAAILITRNIAGSVGKLKLATRRIAEGDFDHVPEVMSRDELGELSHEFVEMSRRLKRLEEMYLDASPLTRLPGGIAIENVLKKRISSGQPLVFCLFDLDNFKSFNDRYGYARGSELILATGDIIEDAARTLGADDDFVGHIGGDDFVVITTPPRFGDMCREVIQAFDRAVPGFYDPEDREKGYIDGKSRQGDKVRFPIVSISIAVVTSQSREFTSHLEVGEIAAELKDYAKSLPGSNYVVDHRRFET
jgi:GGDEF domain-containing protein